MAPVAPGPVPHRGRAIAGSGAVVSAHLTGGAAGAGVDPLAPAAVN